VGGLARERRPEHDPRLRVVLGAGQDGRLRAHARAPARAASTAATTSV